MWLEILNNSNGKAHVVEAPGCEVLLGSGTECDVVIDGLLRQQARVISAGHHVFMTSHRDEHGDVTPVYRDTISEHGTNYHWDGTERRVDRKPFIVGEYTICVTYPPISKWRHRKNVVLGRIRQMFSPSR